MILPSGDWARSSALTRPGVGAAVLAALTWIAGVVADAAVNAGRGDPIPALLSAQTIDSHASALAVGVLSVPLLRRRRRALLQQRQLERAEEHLEAYRSRERATASAAADLRGRVEDCITGDGLSIVLQPIYDIRRQHELVGYEALARFADGRTPETWFAEARQAGLGCELETHAARQALARLDDVPPRAYLSLNLSPDVLVSGALSVLLGDRDASRCVVELTEHCHVESYEELRDTIDGLRRLGVRVAVDDAGAGFSSFRHIVQLGPDIIKLDRDLIRRCNIDPVRRTLATALVSFARDVGASLVAEGVETAGELATLRAMGVRCAQGYYLGRPGGVVDAVVDLIPRVARAQLSSTSAAPSRR